MGSSDLAAIFASENAACQASCHGRGAICPARGGESDALPVGVQGSTVQCSENEVENGKTRILMRPTCTAILTFPAKRIGLPLASLNLVRLGTIRGMSLGKPFPSTSCLMPHQAAPESTIDSTSAVVPSPSPRVRVAFIDW